MFRSRKKYNQKIVINLSYVRKIDEVLGKHKLWDLNATMSNKKLKLRSFNYLSIIVY
jgi:hypothetical protein